MYHNKNNNSHNILTNKNNTLLHDLTGFSQLKELNNIPETKIILHTIYILHKRFLCCLGPKTETL